mgnify:CR=1 FL=1
MRYTSGFTLIELMVTIAVLAIIATISAPSFSNMITHQNLKKSTHELMGTLNQARSKSVLERRSIEVELKQKEEKIELIDTDIKMHWMPKGSVYLENSPTEIHYGLNGGINNATGDTIITLCSQSKGKSQIINISRMGNIQQVTDGTCK